MKVATATVTLKMTGGGLAVGETGEQQGGAGSTREGGEMKANHFCIYSYHHHYHPCRINNHTINMQVEGRGHQEEAISPETKKGEESLSPSQKVNLNIRLDHHHQ